MAVSLTHTTQATGTDAGNGEIRKAQWNEEHTLTMATGNVLARTSASTGPAEEISFAALAAAGGYLTTVAAADISDISANGTSLITAANYAAMRTLLDLEAGTDFYSIAATDSAIDADVATHAALTTSHGVSGTLVGTSDAQTLTNKTLDGDSNTISNLDFGNEVDWAAATDVADRTAFASGDKLVIFEAGVGFRKIDYDDLPGAGGGLSNIVEDTTPQLGGDLDVNGNSIVSTTNGNIAITPNGTGNVSLGNLTFDADQTIGAGQDNFVLTYDNASGLVSLESAGAGSGDVVGPASSTDNRLARFDGITGKLIQESTVSLDDSGNYQADGNITLTGAANTLSTPIINMGTSVDADKFLLYENGNTKYGLGIQGGEVRLFTPTGASNFIRWGDVSTSDGSTFTEWARVSSAGFSVGTGLQATEALDIVGNIAITGTVDGRDLSTDGTKLDGIETAADVTDTANVTAAGAVMDSEVSSLSGIKTLTVPDNTTISTFGATLTDDASASAARTTLGLAIGSDVQAFDADIPTVSASQAEMEAGTEAALRSMSPLRVAQAIAALGGGGGGGGINEITVSTFTATGAGTWTKPTGNVYNILIITGGGGGGVLEGTGDTGSAGGAGGTCIKIFPAGDAAATEAVSIGAGSAASGGSDASNGGNSTFDLIASTITAGGGGGGHSNSAGNQELGGAGGTGTNGDLNITGGTGQSGESGTVVGSVGGSSFWGNNGTFGAGGNGQSDSSTGGSAGGDGVCIVIEFNSV